MVSLKKSTPITFQVYPITPKNFQSTPPKKTPPIPWGKNTHGKDKNFYPYLHHGSYYILLKSL